AGDDERPPARHPALIEIFAPEPQRTRMAFGGGALDLLVNAGIEDLDDLALDLEAMRDVDDILEDAADLLGDRGLAVAGRAVEQHRAAGIDRRPDLVDEGFRDHEIGESLLDRRAVDALVGDALALNAVDVVGERDRNGANILVLLERVHRPSPALLAEHVAHLGLAVGGAENVEQLSLLRLLD